MWHLNEEEMRALLQRAYDEGQGRAMFDEGYGMKIFFRMHRRYPYDFGEFWAKFREESENDEYV